MPKHWWKSKTLWLNIIGAILAIVQGLSGNAWIKPEYQVLILTLGNTILRFITTQPIGK